MPVADLMEDCECTAWVCAEATGALKDNVAVRHASLQRRLSIFAEPGEDAG